MLTSIGRQRLLGYKGWHICSSQVQATTANRWRREDLQTRLRMTRHDVVCVVAAKCPAGSHRCQRGALHLMAPCSAATMVRACHSSLHCRVQCVHLALLLRVATLSRFTSVVQVGALHGTTQGCSYNLLQQGAGTGDKRLLCKSHTHQHASALPILQTLDPYLVALCNSSAASMAMQQWLFKHAVTPAAICGQHTCC